MTTMGIFILTICIEGAIICLIMLYRNKVIFDIRDRASDIISQKAEEAICNGDKNWKRCWDQLDAYGSYDDMLHGDLFKWKFGDFYPGLNEDYGEKITKYRKNIKP